MWARPVKNGNPPLGRFGTILKARSPSNSPSEHKLKALDHLYSPSGSRINTIFETIISGVVGGYLWSSLGGMLVVIGMILAGAWVGEILGAFIGWRIHGDNAYLDTTAQPRSQVLFKLETDQRPTVQASEIMAQMNQEAAAELRHVTALLTEPANRFCKRWIPSLTRPLSEV